MVKLMTSKPSTLHAIESQTKVSVHRPYLGMSGLAHPCSRYLWLSFRWAYKEEHNARLLRLFNRGDREEPCIVRALSTVGIQVHSDQLEYIDGYGHMKGHIDGIAEGVLEAPKTPHLAEFKTMNYSNFKKVCKLGVKESHVKYYGQMQIYMHKGKLKRALFVAVNKNDDSMYIERVYYDKDYSLNLVEKGCGIIISEMPQPAVYKPTWYECKFCNAREVCHFGKPLEKNCRTCENVAPAPKGLWKCKDEHVIPLDIQRKGCKHYRGILI